MEKKLIPAHVLFAKWFIRIRWLAIFVLVVSTAIIKFFIKIPVQDVQIFILAAILLALNILHTSFLKQITAKESNKVIIWIKREIHLQIVTDLIVLTLILHYSGGVENPIILFYYFHMMIASSIFSTFNSYLHTSLALIFIGLMAFLECYAIIPHYHLKGFTDPSLYQNKFFIYGAGFIFIATSFLLASLTHMIVTKSIKIEETYVKTNLELEKKDKLQNEYVLHVTHDIKGHLGSVASCLNVIRAKIIGPLNDKQEEFVNRAYERTELLTGFIKDLLNLTKKRLMQETEFEEFSIRDLIAKVVSSVQILAQDKSIDVNVVIDNPVQTIVGNPYTLEELYSNLLQNAVKYTPANGHIELIVRNRFDHIITEISDSGIGIPKEDLPKVFDEFYRAGNVPKDLKTGSGLGLSIVKQIIESHKGKIWVSSEPGLWTKFTFTLPKNPIQPEI